MLGGGSIRMPERTVWIDDIAEGLFDLAGFGEALLLCAREQQRAVEEDIKSAGICGTKSDFVQIVFKGGEEFLGKPSGAQ